MSTELARHDEFFSREQLDTIKNVLCPGLTDPELGLFKEVCRSKGLSPFAKQIYVTKRPTWDPELKKMVPKMTIQTGIDGLRLIAERSKKYRGQTPFEWCGPDGVWKQVWLDAKPPAAARAGVLRADFDQPLYRVARWGAYVQTKSGGEVNSMWAKMGPEQLAKCAEALALRTAFPEELSGLYTDDEMGQAENEPTPPRAPLKDASTPPPNEPPPRKLPTATSSKYEPAKSVPFKSLSTPQLVAYIAHYTAKQEDPTLNDFHRAGIRDHIQASSMELEARRKLEAEMAGANPETGEVIPDATFEEAPPNSGESREREPGEDDNP